VVRYRRTTDHEEAAMANRKLDGKTDKAKGRLKEAAGSLTDRDDLRNEGVRDQDKGDLKQGWQKVKDAVNPDK
jgi:uncharacterized protein YjbJ (UPF0337 family)